MRHRRGFVKEAEEYAEEFRTELGLQNDDPICPFSLAELLDIPLRGLVNDSGLSAEVKTHFSTVGRDAFSATTIFDGHYCEIVFNDTHHDNRIASSIMHEVAHVLLKHPPRPPLSEDGCRSFDRRLEKEANDLGWIILVPKRAALRALMDFRRLNDAAIFYGVSMDLLEYRIRKSDARRWKRNIENRRG